MNDTNIGKEFGKDRTTVGHNIEKIEESIDTNSTIKSDVNYILKDLNYNEDKCRDKLLITCRFLNKEISVKKSDLGYPKLSTANTYCMC